MESLAASGRVHSRDPRRRYPGSSEAVGARAFADQTAVVTQSSAADRGDDRLDRQRLGHHRRAPRLDPPPQGYDRTGANEMTSAAEAVGPWSVLLLDIGRRGRHPLRGQPDQPPLHERRHRGGPCRGRRQGLLRRGRRDPKALGGDGAEREAHLDEHQGHHRLDEDGFRGEARAQELFRQIDRQADSVAAAMDEIARGIGEASEGRGRS